MLSYLTLKQCDVRKEWCREEGNNYEIYPILPGESNAARLKNLNVFAKGDACEAQAKLSIHVHRFYGTPAKIRRELNHAVEKAALGGVFGSGEDVLAEKRGERPQPPREGAKRGSTWISIPCFVIEATGCSYGGFGSVASGETCMLSITVTEWHQMVRR